ncbi:MAG: hypothetical protein IT318_16195 [Anaerolineales bacterium]|nr:hypothetical protein [Anaerolineales bacterium]
MIQGPTLCILLTLAQIDSAQHMWAELPGWQAYDLALKEAARAFPSNTESAAVLVKVAALDRLYFTNLKNLIAVSDQIVAVFGTPPVPEGCDLVMALSHVGGQRLVSFASKYVHFFHDGSLPLTDWYALYALVRHFQQPEARIETWRQAYHTYFAKIMELKRLSGVEATAREMDHYLWLAGNWLYYQKKGPATQQNTELKRYFAAPDRKDMLEAAFAQLL